MNENQKVLVIDDEASIRNLIRMHLESSGYQVVEAAQGIEGLNKLKSDQFDIILLDLGLPDINGIEVLASLREIVQTPVVIMTVQSDERSKVMALDAGADDYLVKPFGLEELKARIRAALRRIDNQSPQEMYENGPLIINFQMRKVYVNDKEIKLTSKEFEFLRILALQTGKLVSRSQVLLKIWGNHAEDKGHYLRIYVGQLRKKIPIKGLITTEPAVGYRLNFL